MNSVTQTCVSIYSDRLPISRWHFNVNLVYESKTSSTLVDFKGWSYYFMIFFFICFTALLNALLMHEESNKITTHRKEWANITWTTTGSSEMMPYGHKPQYNDSSGHGVVKGLLQNCVYGCVSTWESIECWVDVKLTFRKSSVSTFSTLVSDKYVYTVWIHRFLSELKIVV